MNSKLNILFFGTPQIAVHVLDALRDANMTPSLIVSNPDAKVGRKQIITPPKTAQWAKEHSVALTQPESLRDSGSCPLIANQAWDIIVVIAYGKIIPDWILALPKYGTLNVHPSLLPELRGASPIRSAILEDKRETGVTIMLMDNELDHGPILTQEVVVFVSSEWPIDGNVLDEKLARIGGKLLVETIPEWVDGTIEPQEQDHSQATFCTKITKEMGRLDIDPNNLPSGDIAYKMLLTVKAFVGWPETFFIHNDKRVKIKDASLSEDGGLLIQTVVPEGKKEMSFKYYLDN